MTNKKYKWCLTESNQKAFCEAPNNRLMIPNKDDFIEDYAIFNFPYIVQLIQAVFTNKLGKYDTKSIELNNIIINKVNKLQSIKNSIQRKNRYKKILQKIMNDVKFEPYSSKRIVLVFIQRYNEKHEESADKFSLPETDQLVLDIVNNRIQYDENDFKDEITLNQNIPNVNVQCTGPNCNPNNPLNLSQMQPHMQPQYQPQMQPQYQPQMQPQYQPQYQPLPQIQQGNTQLDDPGECIIS